MRQNIYSIYDTAIGGYKTPFFLHSDAQACREFQDIFNNDNPISLHPEDYYLVRLGTWNDGPGTIIQNQGDVETLMTGLEAIASLNAEAQAAGNGREPATIHDISPGGTV